MAFVDADVRAFWTEFMPGFFVVDAASDVVFEVKLSRPDSTREIWSDTFRGKGKVSGMAVTRGMFEESLNLAYSEAMKNLYKEISEDKMRQAFKNGGQ